MKQINGLNIPQSLEDICNPRQMALLVYDMQVGICSQLKSGAKITAQVALVLAAARKAGMRVVYTRHLSMPKTWMGVTQFRTAMAWQRKEEPDDVSPWFLRDSPGFEIVPELKPTADEAVFDKLAFSAFEGTPLTSCLARLRHRLTGDRRHRHRDRHRADRKPRRGPWLHPGYSRGRLRGGSRRGRQRSLESLRFMGDTVISDVATFTRLLGA